MFVVERGLYLWKFFYSIHLFLNNTYLINIFSSKLCFVEKYLTLFLRYASNIYVLLFLYYIIMIFFSLFNFKLQFTTLLFFLVHVNWETCNYINCTIITHIRVSMLACAAMTVIYHLYYIAN